MSEPTVTKNAALQTKSNAIYIEAVVIVLIAIFILYLQYGNLNPTILLSYHALITTLGGLGVWLANRFIFERILQSKIESTKITRYLPLELLMVSILVTSVIYIIIYLSVIYIEKTDFVFTYFLQGFSGTIGLSLLIMLLYVGIQLWNAWWSDGEFLFRITDNKEDKGSINDFISIKNPRGTMNVDLNEVGYFISESKMVFLVDRSGKKWITQYNLSELEKIVDSKFFRLNRRIMVSRPIISHIKKLPNHRLLVTIGHSNEGHYETISRYKSTKFKQWFHSAQQ